MAPCEWPAPGSAAPFPALDPFRRWTLLLGLLILFAATVTGRTADLTVAAAADLKFAMDELVSIYRTNRPASRVRVTYGSSGNFFAQIRNRAPFDLYFSADIEYPRKLAEAGHALDTNVFLYAMGRLVVWNRKASPVEVEKLGISSLLAPVVKTIAIANPQHAPYGRAAVAAMKSLGVYDQAAPRLVYGENIAQAAQFVQSGSADIGVIALALAMAPVMRENGRYWEIPTDSYPPIEQGGMISKWTREPEAARAFRDFVLGTSGRGVLQRHGFILPEGNAWTGRQSG